MKSPSSNKVFPAELSEVFWNQKKKKKSFMIICLKLKTSYGEFETVMA